MEHAVQEALCELSEEVRDLSLAFEVDRVDGVPHPLEFYRNYVSRNVPCIITNAINHWPCLRQWTNEYLVEKMGDRLVTIDVTPDGLGDAIVTDPDGKPCFVTPLEESVPFSSFLDELCSGKRDAGRVLYASHQNGSFVTEYGPLVGDADVNLPWATEAFGYGPEAVNLWIGDDRAVTSFHKDHYENLYAVIAGEKHFTLQPPADVHRLYVRNYPKASYVRGEGSSLRIDYGGGPPSTVPWVTVDPDDPEKSDRFPLYDRRPPALKCVVKAGELLYLPAMYYHHVTQKPDEQGRTIAINFWYDMDFDVKYAYHKLVEKLSGALSPIKDES